MKILLALCLVAVSLASEDALSVILKSPKATLKLYGDFKTKQNIKYVAAEDRMRFRLFKKNAEFVASSNLVFEDSADYELNFFSAMTEDEKKQWLGLNATNHLPNDDIPVPLSASLSTPSEKLWVNEGAVTEVKNQRSCGSCWTFAAVGGLETRYKVLSGRLRNFAEQEYLDCVYEGQKDGCRGGWPDNAYSYSANNGGRLAATADYSYEASDSACKASSKPNAALAYKIDGYTSAGSTEASNIAALASGSLSMAFEVTNKLHQYRSGIMRDDTCTGRINHGVTGVGYTANYVLVKNSWGAGWGDNGFVKFARNHGNCDPSGDDDDIPDPVCEDKAVNCTREYCTYQDIANKYCRKTCGMCCPSGTIRCPDSVCRHEHMC
jgi:C1A family cysteine protease